jgi:hypothetical protein
VTLKPGATYADVVFNQEMCRNATIVYDTALAMGGTIRDAEIGLATAMQESRFHNYLHPVDHDSLGIFQQRPSQGWGTPAQVTDPHYASRKFFEAELRVPHRLTRPLAEVAQAVQRSAFPNAFAKWEPLAKVLAKEIPVGRDWFSMATEADLKRALKEVLLHDRDVQAMLVNLMFVRRVKQGTPTLSEGLRMIASIDRRVAP